MEEAIWSVCELTEEDKLVRVGRLYFSVVWGYLKPRQLNAGPQQGMHLRPLRVAKMMTVITFCRNFPKRKCLVLVESGSTGVCTTSSGKNNKSWYNMDTF